MRLLELLIVLISVATVAGYVCRLDGLRFRSHKLRVILLHVALMAGAGAAGFSAWGGHFDLQDFAGLASAIAWLWTSLPTWRHGPPSHVTKAEPLPLSDWSKVHGGKK